MAAMDFAKWTLSARKAWFYFDDEVVCLGAAIGSNTANSVLTSMNQCLLDGVVTVKDSLGTRTVANGDHLMTSLQWAHHDGVGYVFPGLPNVRLKNQTQSNTWNYINDVYPAGEIDSQDVFSLWIDHGAYVSGGSYQYVVVPDVDASATDQYAHSLPILVLSNAASIQAVEQRDLHVIQAAFHSPGTVAGMGGVTVAVDQPCLVMVREIGADVALSVANPANQALNLDVDISRYLTGMGATWLPGSGVTRVAVSLPDGNDAGKSVTVSLAGVASDFDRDNDVDQVDFGHFQVCVSGAAQVDPACTDADLNGDGAVDEADFILFEACMSGSGLLPGC
jgi:chondroitin AC lyase